MVEGLFSKSESQRIIARFCEVTSGVLKKYLTRAGGLYKSDQAENNKAAQRAMSKALMTAVMPDAANTERNDWNAEIWWTTAAARFCGHRGSPMMENGQSPCMPPSGTCIIEAKLKNTVARNNTSTNTAVTFCNEVDMRYVIITSLS